MGVVKLVFIGLIIVLIINTTIARGVKPGEKTKARVCAFVTLGIFAIFIIWAIAGEYVKDNLMVFKSPEAAFRSSYFRAPDVTVMGDESAFMFTRGGITQGNSEIALKTENGWKLDYSRISKMVSVCSYYADGLSISVLSHIYVEDYYVSISQFNYNFDVSDEPLEIYDECGSEFIRYEGITGAGRIYYRYYAYIKDYDGLYTIYINDEMYELRFDTDIKLRAEYN